MVQPTNEALRFNAVLESIDLSDNYLDAEAGKALASALEVNAVLTTLRCTFCA